MLHRIGGPVFYINEDGYPCWAHEEGAKEIVCSLTSVISKSYEEAVAFIEKRSEVHNAHVYVGQLYAMNGPDVVILYAHIGEFHE